MMTMYILLCSGQTDNSGHHTLCAILRQTAVTAYLKSEQFLMFAFEMQFGLESIV